MNSALKQFIFDRWLPNELNLNVGTLPQEQLFSTLYESIGCLRVSFELKNIQYSVIFCKMTFTPSCCLIFCPLVFQIILDIYDIFYQLEPSLAMLLDAFQHIKSGCIEMHRNRVVLNVQVDNSCSIICKPALKDELQSSAQFSCQCF